MAGHLNSLSASEALGGSSASNMLGPVDRTTVAYQSVPISVLSMCLDKYLDESRKISRIRIPAPNMGRLQLVGRFAGRFVKVEPGTEVSGSTPRHRTAEKWTRRIRTEHVTDPGLQTGRSCRDEVTFMQGQFLVPTGRHQRSCTVTTPWSENKSSLAEKGQLEHSVKVHPVTAASSVRSAQSPPKKRYRQFGPSDGETAIKSENMVVSVLNATSNSLLSKQTLKSSLEWGHSPPHNSTSETDQPTCLLNFDACNQRRSSPVQNDEENSCYDSEAGGENMSPPQENSRSSTSEELGANLFPITGFGSSSNCAEYLNSDEKDSQQSSPPYYQDDDMYQTTTRGCNNNNNKPKVHKCRSCGFTTTNKHESWEHIALHMKPEKILRCTKCPFVTEYKHHLDFHMQNHEGKKPFKCDKCHYECVNKSMLKSHSKSHSSVYPFQCESCGYKTKYCHSMKIHLRRHKLHQPKAVLDEEGNPDPNLFIDIHSNRRGPKQKKQKSEAQQRQRLQQQQLQRQQQLQQQQQELAQPVQSAPPPPFTHPPPLATLAQLNYGAWPEKVFAETAPFGYPVLAQPAESDQEEIFMAECIEEKPVLSSYYLSPFDPMALALPPLAAGRLKEEPEEAPLNLCPQVVEAPLNLSVSHNSSHTSADTAVSSASSSASGCTPTVKNRRKGVACKLKRYAETGCAGEEIAQVAQSMSGGSDVASLDQSLENAVSEAENEPVGLRNKTNGYYCEYCEITFHNQIMFTLHKGCHGFSDPFTCNRCGAKTDNKIDFYAHMISVAHL